MSDESYGLSILDIEKVAVFMLERGLTVVEPKYCVNCGARLMSEHRAWLHNCPYCKIAYAMDLDTNPSDSGGLHIIARDSRGLGQMWDELKDVKEKP